MCKREILPAYNTPVSGCSLLLVLSAFRLVFSKGNIGFKSALAQLFPVHQLRPIYFAALIESVYLYKRPISSGSVTPLIKTNKSIPLDAI